MLTERQRARLRGAHDAILRAEDAVAEVADEQAHRGPSEADRLIDDAAAHLREAGAALEALLTGGPSLSRD